MRTAVMGTMHVWCGLVSGRISGWILDYCAGVDAGSRLRVRGEGNVGRRGGEPGDLYVFISVKAHPQGLRREGTTIHSEVEISFVDAILGTTAKVSSIPLIYGNTQLGCP